MSLMAPCLFEGDIKVCCRHFDSDLVDDFRSSREFMKQGHCLKSNSVRWFRGRANRTINKQLVNVSSSEEEKGNDTCDRFTVHTAGVLAPPNTLLSSSSRPVCLLSSSLNTLQDLKCHHSYSRRRCQSWLERQTALFTLWYQTQRTDELQKNTIISSTSESESMTSSQGKVQTLTDI